MDYGIAYKVRGIQAAILIFSFHIIGDKGIQSLIDKLRRLFLRINSVNLHYNRIMTFRTNGIKEKWHINAVNVKSHLFKALDVDTLVNDSIKLTLYAVGLAELPYLYKFTALNHTLSY